MNISPKLQLNFHPKDADNLSFVTASNIKLSNDGSCITNEESIKKNTFIDNYLRIYYNAISPDSIYEIVGIIPCNDELVIICVNNDNRDKAKIFRYREKDSNNKQSIKLAYGTADDSVYLEYHEGKIKGAFTYNVENSLIIAIAEYDGNVKKIPLRVINLGNFDDDTIYNDIDLENNRISISPEVRIPSMNDISYVSGNSYKGWYYIFIRFKINSVDYTQWFNFGYPIYVDTLEQFSIIKYCFNVDQKFAAEKDTGILYPPNPECGYVAGCSDYFSNTSDIAKETFKFNILFNDSIVFDKYQIGIVNASKTATRAFRTSDIIKTSNSEYFTLNISSLIEYSVEELIIDNYNYFDVKNIINYKNRLYIANYRENNANDDSITDDFINGEDGINVSFDNSHLNIDELTYELGIINRDRIQSNQYESHNRSRISFVDFFNCSEDTKYSISLNGDVVATDTANNLFFTTIDSPVSTEQSSGLITIGQYVYEGTGVYTVKYIISYPIAVMEDNSCIIHNEDDPNAQDYIFNQEDVAMQWGRIYINPNIDFNLRKLNGTLIPGEVYNFFIHFVDKYGHSTNGYRINNNNKWNTNNDINNGKLEDAIPIKFYSKSRSNYCYAALDINSNVINSGTNKINTNGIEIYSTVASDFKFEGQDLIPRNEQGTITDDTLINEFITYFDTFNSDKYIDVKWFQVACPINIATPYINNNGDRLFRVPYDTDSEIVNYTLDMKNNISTKKTFVVYPKFSNIKIPNDYIGYFISYEKYEPTIRYTGVLVRSDFRTQDYIKNKGRFGNIPDFVILDNANNKKSDYVNFYSSQFDISDSIRLDYNVLRIEGENIFKLDDITEYDYLQLTSFFNYPHDMNKPQTGISGPVRCYGIDDYKLSVADSAVDNRMGLGTCMKIKDIYNIFPIYDTTVDINSKIKIFKVSLCNYSRDIYMSNNKTLIRLTNIMYATDNNPENIYSITVDKGLPGHITNDGIIIYENSGYSHNTADNVVRRYNLNSKYYKTEIADATHTFENQVPFLAYVQLPIYSDIFYESKSYKNEPTGVVYYVKQDTDNLDRGNENNKFSAGCLVSPANSIDLFENKQSSFDTFYVKTFTNYRKDLVSVDEFNKTVRRSSVIQDETRENNWRNFPVEGYKNITENKGIITNLVGIGTMLIVHTEHSMFAFSTDNTLTTNEAQKIQLAQPDAFEINYIEITTSTLGFGGLQDDEAFVVDQFGYIFYNNDFHRFYNFDNGKLSVIDDDIIQWLDKYKPYNVRFANDKFNNRVIIKMNYKVANEEKEVVMSYNYGINHFISTHDYRFEEAYNTKYNLYLKYANNENNSSLYQFVQDGSSYGNFDNNKDNSTTSIIYPSKVGIIINEQYNDIKYLEQITYILSKCVNPANKDYTNLPVEELIMPYSANYIRVYNNETDTGTLDVLIDSEDSKNIFGHYDKPWWELGNWNFNYLRNNISEYNKYGDAFNMSRIYGNYFIVEYTFSNTDNLKVEFEELKYKITK